MTSQPGSFPQQPGEFPGPYQYSQELPLGDWRLMVNGRVLGLQIRSISFGGHVNAELSSGTVENAVWDGVGTPLMAGKLSFVRVLDDLRQQLEGWLFQYDPADPLWRMAGTIVHLDKSDARSGWYGTLPRR